MINPFKEINWKPGATELRKFAWSLVIGFPSIALIFFLVAWLRGGHLPEPGGSLELAGGGVVAGLVSMAAPALARPLYLVWYAVAACIGLVVSNLLFVAIYYVMFAPIGLVARVFGRDPLGLRVHRESSTHWREAPPTPPPARYFRQY